MTAEQDQAAADAVLAVCAVAITEWVVRDGCEVPSVCQAFVVLIERTRKLCAEVERLRGPKAVTKVCPFCFDVVSRDSDVEKALAAAKTHVYVCREHPLGKLRDAAAAVLDEWDEKWRLPDDVDPVMENLRIAARLQGAPTDDPDGRAGDEADRRHALDDDQRHERGCE